MLEISVNGERKALAQVMVLEQAMQAWGFDPADTLVIAVNQTFVPRDRWMDTEIQAADEIDILQPIVGG
ncbi:MAG: Thiamine biosynthesis protein ThiS [uncultured Thiotrichaceae bacterium]|uniref:Thiamine biosynthesis protein ThiS n=1 Tax=uncultured Thiotrichaceae bacterium TaxID=298394 RepID=A0A6S6TKA7_9GAMM|nr:MAG: Thiamine biosynthesis protein ThiS [uncultured Thiotrichaceae bacterium]